MLLPIEKILLQTSGGKKYNCENTAFWWKEKTTCEDTGGRKNLQFIQMKGCRINANLFVTVFF
jgi:hypothetical protein